LPDMMGVPETLARHIEHDRAVVAERLRALPHPHNHVFVLLDQVHQSLVELAPVTERSDPHMDMRPAGEHIRLPTLLPDHRKKRAPLLPRTVQPLRPVTRIGDLGAVHYWRDKLPIDIVVILVRPPRLRIPSGEPSVSTFHLLVRLNELEITQPPPDSP